MSIQPVLPVAARDGSSQRGRSRAALQPGYVQIDERSLEDLLAFAQAHAQQLRYFNEANEPEGTWSEFLRHPNLDAGAIAAYLENPDRAAADPELRAWYARPHFVLFATFLKLLRHARDELNQLSARHLAFYFEKALALTARGAESDHVHVLVELAKGQKHFRLPQGTLLAAGKDDDGPERLYRTEHDLVASRASVDGLTSLFIARQRIGLHELRKSPDARRQLPSFRDLEQASQATGSTDEMPTLCMLALVLGEPAAGGRLPAYPGSPGDLPPLKALDRLLQFITRDLCLPLPAFRSLLQLKLKLAPASDERWASVNGTLLGAGKAREPGFAADFSRAPDDFDGNLLKALGLPAWGKFFDTLPEVDDIHDLFRLRERADVRAFIDGNALHMPFGPFVAMMEAVEGIHRDWRRVYDILRAAARKKAPGWMPAQSPRLRDYDTAKFETLVRATLGQIAFPEVAGLKSADFDGCYSDLLTLESYFHLSAEDFFLFRQVAAKPGAQPWEWDQVYERLERAHLSKSFKDSRERGFDELIRFALGDPGPGDPLPENRQFLDLDAYTDAAYIREKLFLETANFAEIRDIQQRGSSDPADWAKVYRLLELARSRKRGPPRVYVEFRDGVRTSRRVPVAEPGSPPWRAFDGDADATASIGFALASPLLALAEGQRSIVLTLHFDAAQFDAPAVAAVLENPVPLEFRLSTAGGMLPLVETDGVSASLAVAGQTAADPPGSRALRITLELAPRFPAVVPCPAEPGIRSHWPVLELRLANLPEKNSAVHRAFSGLLLRKAVLEVAAAGLLPASLQNDDGPLNPKKPFEPFGPAPVAGSSLYLGHPELCAKRLDRLSILIEWLGAPDDLNAHYRGYSGFEKPEPGTPAASPFDDNRALTAQLFLYDNRQLSPVASLGLFNADPKNLKTGASQPRTNEIVLNAAGGFQQKHPSYGFIALPDSAGNLVDWDRYWKLELDPKDFQHGVYTRAAFAYANRKNGSTADPYVLNPPYTPKIKRLTLGYRASEEMDPVDPAAAGRLYHIEPFGYREPAASAHAVDPAGSGSIPATPPSSPPHWLPQYPNAAELFIGIKDLEPPQTLSLLFQIAEGSADPDAGQEPLTWWYLDGNRWASLDAGKVLADDTDGLLNSGVVAFDLPPALPGTLLPPDRYWLRAAIAGNGRAVGDLVAVHAQAVRAVAAGPEPSGRMLPAGTITGLAAFTPEVRAIHQPYSSTGGRGPEAAGHFHTRVSERLRHRNRALTPWDYEHLVLEAFPDVYKVRCLPAGTSDDPRQALGIRVIVVPDIRDKLPSDPFGPKVSTERLAEIERFLLARAAPVARLTVANPTYLSLRVRLGVRLKTVGNPGYYRQALEQALLRYLAPWAYDESAEIVFGGRVNANLIVDFVERLDYVDYVAGIKLFATLPGETTQEVDEQFVVPAETIAVPDRSHDIDFITGEVYESAYFSGIGYLKVELDFTVAADPLAPTPA